MLISKRKNKKGMMGIILFFLALFTILIVGFIASMVVSSVDYVSDELTPVMEDLGVVGSVNLSEVSGYTFGNLDRFVQALPWLLGFSYVIALIFSIIFVMAYPLNPHPVYIGFYIMMMILLIFGSIVISNMYEDIYSGSDEIALRLQEQTLMSYMILYSPFILALIGIFSGIWLFSRADNGGGEF